ncbi:hypothetical protein D9M72_283030 [compost metagenome]
MRGRRTASSGGNAGDRLGEILGLERLQIVDAFTDADEVDRQLVPGGDGNEDAAARRA